jgi:hypothetical protein
MQIVPTFLRIGVSLTSQECQAIARHQANYHGDDHIPLTQTGWNQK